MYFGLCDMTDEVISSLKIDKVLGDGVGSGKGSYAK